MARLGYTTLEAEGLNVGLDSYQLGMFQGSLWDLDDTRTIYYCFPASVADFPAFYFYGSGTDFVAFNSAQKDCIREFFAEVALFADVTFVERTTNMSTDPAELFFFSTSGSATSAAGFPHNVGYNGFVKMGVGAGTAVYRGSRTWMVHYHEACHALGLKHGHEISGFDTNCPIIPSYTGFPAGTDTRGDRNTIEYSVVTYRSYATQTGSLSNPWVHNTYNYPHTLRGLDVWALQHLYGAKSNTDNRTWKWTPDSFAVLVNGSTRFTGYTTPGSGVYNKKAETIAYPTTGTKTLDFSSYTDGITADLRPGGNIHLEATITYPNGGSIGVGAYQILTSSSGYIMSAGHITTPDYLDGVWLVNEILLGSGENVVHAHSGTLYIDGGSGDNTVVFHNDFANYEVTNNGDGTFTIEDLGTPDAALDGVITVENVQNFEFADFTYGPDDFPLEDSLTQTSRAAFAPTFYAASASQSGNQDIVQAASLTQTTFFAAVASNRFKSVRINWIS